MRKIITMNIDIEKLQVFDSYLVPPCGRSDLWNEIMGYMILNPTMLTHFVNKKNSEIQNLLASIPNNE